MFDWGAQAVSDILEKEDSFGLQEALSSIQSRPWLIDNLDTWLNRLKVGLLQIANSFKYNIIIL